MIFQGYVRYYPIKIADINNNHGLDSCYCIHRLGEIGIESLSKVNSSKNWLYLIY